MGSNKINTMPKYDLIYEDNGELKIKSVNAETKDQAQKQAMKTKDNVKGIVFSDENQIPSEQDWQQKGYDKPNHD